MERNKKLSDRLLNTDEYAEELKAMMSVVEIKNIYNDFSVSLLNVRTHIKDRKDVSSNVSFAFTKAPGSEY